MVHRVTGRDFNKALLIKNQLYNCMDSHEFIKKIVHMIDNKVDRIIYINTKEINVSCVLVGPQKTNCICIHFKTSTTGGEQQEVPHQQGHHRDHEIEQ